MTPRKPDRVIVEMSIDDAGVIRLHPDRGPEVTLGHVGIWWGTVDRARASMKARTAERKQPGGATPSLTATECRAVERLINRRIGDELVEAMTVREEASLDSALGRVRNKLRGT